MRSAIRKIRTLLIILILLMPFVYTLEVEATTSWDISLVDTLVGKDEETNDVRATFDTTTKTLIISGTGKMKDFERIDILNPNGSGDRIIYYNTPWRDKNDDITNIIIGKGVTSVGANAFRECKNLTRLNIASRITELGEEAIPINDNLVIRYRTDKDYNKDYNNLIKGFIESNSSKVKGEIFQDVSREEDDSVIAIYNKETDTMTVEGKGSVKDGAISNALLSCRTSKLIIKEGVLNIGGQGECAGNPYLSIVEIPSSVWEIPANAFVHCENLKIVRILGNQTTIAATAFTNCKNVVIHCNSGSQAEANAKSNGISYIAGTMWDVSENGDRSVTAILSDNGTLTISGTGKMKNYSTNESSPWHESSKVREVIIKSGVTNIGTYAFRYCKNLTDVWIYNGITEIGNFAFYGCAKLTYMDIPNSVTNIGNSAFYGCQQLTNITIPESVSNIGNSGFSNCENLTSIFIPNSVTNIGHNAFFNCQNLTSIFIPNSVTNIGTRAFADCPNVTIRCYENSEAHSYAKTNNINYELIVKYYDLSEYGDKSIIATLSTDKKILTISGIGRMKDYSPSANYPPWQGGMVNDLENLENIEIKEGITHIGRFVFNSRKQLKNVNIPNSVISIGNQAFMDCNNLTNIQIPENTTSVGLRAFYGCENLTAINVKEGNQKYESQNGVLFTKGKTKIVCYPAGKKNQNYRIPDSVTSIEESAFASCNNLTNIIIPKSVTNIAGNAFSNCSNLTIGCYENSTAHQYAEEQSIVYYLIETPTNITLSDTNIELDLSGTKEKVITYIINPINANTDTGVIWTSSNEKVAKVENGKVTAVGVGTCTITATTENGKIAKCTVTVVKTSQDPSNPTNPSNPSNPTNPSNPGNGSGSNNQGGSGSGSNNQSGSGSGSNNQGGSGTGSNSQGSSSNQSGLGSGSSSTGSNSKGTSSSSNRGTATTSKSSAKGTSSTIPGSSSDSLANKVIPKTGYEMGLLVGIIVLSGFAIVCYKKARMY